MKRNRSPTSKNVTLCSSFGSQSVLNRFSIGSRSVLVRFSFGSRSVLVRFSIDLRSSFVHPPFILRSGIEDRSKIDRRTNGESSKNQRRFIGGKTEMYRNSNGKPRERRPEQKLYFLSLKFKLLWQDLLELFPNSTALQVTLPSDKTVVRLLCRKKSLKLQMRGPNVSRSTA